MECVVHSGDYNSSKITSLQSGLFQCYNLEWDTDLTRSHALEESTCNGLYLASYFEGRQIRWTSSVQNLVHRGRTSCQIGSSEQVDVLVSQPSLSERHTQVLQTNLLILGFECPHHVTNTMGLHSLI